MNHLLLHLLGAALTRELVGLHVGSMRVLRPLVVLPVGGRGAQRWLVIILSSPGPFCFLSDQDPLDGLGELAFRRIDGRRIGAVRVERDERVVRIVLADSDREESLAFYAFGSAGRVRVEAGGTIIESLAVKETGMEVGLASRAPRVLDEDDIARFSSGEAIYLTGEGRNAATPNTAKGEAASGPFADAIEACASVGSVMVGSAHGLIVERATATIRRHIAKVERLRDQLQVDLDRAKNFEAGRNEANILAAFQSRIRPGTARIQLPDLYNAGKEVTIALDPAVAIAEQIQKRFKKATKLERGREVLEKRVRTSSRRIDTISSALDDALGSMRFADTYRALTALIKKHNLAKRTPAAARTAVTREYREFDLSPDWFAIVGRNDRENDEITFRVARPDDIWLHAQQIPGSHVVLRPRGAGGNPPQPVLEIAAAIAAHFSKAKHSNLVPVIYTRRKYVRKFRGAKPGQVTCEREKTIFAKPGLPDQRADAEGDG